MSLQTDSVHAAEILERLKNENGSKDEDLTSLVCLLDSPLFQRLLTLQGSLEELKQISASRQITEDNFDFSPTGELLINEELQDTADGVPIVSPVHAGKLSVQLPEDSEYLGPGSAISTHKYNIEFQRAIEKSAQGRDVENIGLMKEENKSLGFSVVGLKSENQGDLGIFVQGIQPDGIADRDGRLQEGDQILAINGQPLDISHNQAIRILQSARGPVEIVVARGSIPTSDQSGSETTEPTQLPPPDNAADMVLNTDWTQIEVIDVINDGSGLGFGIIGGRSTGVVVKTILPGGVADTDGRLRSGDHILQIGDVNVRGMSSEQVASVLRQSGSHVRLVVARAVMEPATIPIPHAPIIPTNQLDEQLQNLFSADSQENIELSGLTEDQINRFQSTGAIPPGFLGAVEVYPPPQDMGIDSPEVEMFDVDLSKDSQGLGITIAGYVGGEKSTDELSGIFVKSISEGSAAAVDGRILVNDQIVEVDGNSLHGFTNHQAVDVLRNTGQTVHLKLIRYKHGPKYEQLQQYHAQANMLTSNSLSGSQPIIMQNGMSDDVTSFTSQVYDAISKPVALENINLYTDDDYSGELLPDVEAAIKACWEPIVGNDFDVTVAQLSKFEEKSGLGISLEGTVDVENGVEVRPHHYIRSILPQGPVGVNGRLQSGDELLEVNGKRLLGLNHVEVVSILKELPKHVRIVCARRKKPATENYAQNNKDDQFFASSFYTGVQASSAPMFDRLVKSKSEMALSSPDHTAVQNSLNKMKSRSLEPLTGLAMWSCEPVVIELTKADKGLGFSILDYQDPMNPSDIVIVIRSLVPGGVAQQDGRLVPGDRLIFVGDVNLENATLDQAVQALKGAPKGIVRIGVAKPLPIPETLHESHQIAPVFTPDLENNQPVTTSITAQVEEEVNQAPVFIPPISPTPPLQSPERAESPLMSSSDSETDYENIKERDLENEFEQNLSREDLIQATKRMSFTSQTLFPSPGCQDGMTTSADSNSLEGDLVILAPPPLYNEVVSTEIETSLPVWDDDSEAPPVPPRVVSTETDQVIDHVTDHVTETVKQPEQLLHDSSSDDEKFSTELSPPVIPTKPLLAPKPYSLLRTVQATRKHSGESSGASSPRSPTNQSAVKPNTDVINTSSLSKVVTVETKVQHKAPPPVPPKPKISLDLLSHKQEELPPPPPLTSPPPLDDRDSQIITSMRTEEEIQVNLASHFLHSKTESIDSSSSSEPITTSDLKAINSPSSTPRTLSPGLSPLASPNLIRAWSTSPNALPSSLEKTIKVVKGNDQLGLTVEAVDKGINGCVIKSLAKGSAVAKDGRLCPGDYIVNINNESMRRITNAQARAILRRSSLLSTNINITYVTAADVANYRETASVESRDSSTAVYPVMTSPKIYPKYYRSPLSSSSVQKESPLSSPTQLPVSMVTTTETTSDVVFNTSQSPPPPVALPPVTAVPAPISSPRQKSLAADGSPAISEQTWGPARVVQLEREPGRSLGISIVGGRVDLFHVDQEHAISGIFIKHVLEDSPAGKNGTLKTGDRILEVDGVDLRNATHDQAVEVIRRATNPVKFVVQNLVDSSCPRDLHDADSKSVHSYDDGPLVAHSSFNGEGETIKLTMQDGPIGESTTDGDATEKTEVVIEEDEYGYTLERLQEKYGDLNGNLHLVDLTRGSNGLGISLAGNKDRNTMSVFVAGVQPEGAAARDGRVQVGDELLEVNGQVLYGRSHLNASAIIKGLSTSAVKIVLLRREDVLEQMAVKPLKLTPVLPTEVPTSTKVAINEPVFHDGSSPTPEISIRKSSPVPAPPSSSLEATNQIKTITLEKGTTGLGFAICEGNNDGNPAILVKNLTPGGVAAEEGTLSVGDHILEVDDTSLIGVHYEKAIEALRRTHGVVKLKIRKCSPASEASLPAQSVIQFNAVPGESTTDPADISPRAESPPPDPRTCPIAPGREVHIQIEKGRTGLGLSIVGGSDTLLGSIIVHEVYEEGAAARDNRLVPGDQILEVNYEDLRDASHERAIQVLRQTPASVQMIVFRDNNELKDDIYDIFSVDLMKKPGKGLGISIVGKRNDVGVFISDVVKSGVAEADGRLMQGDQILAVNGEDFRNITQDDAAAVLKTLMGKVSLTVGRLKAGSRTSSRKNSGAGTGLKKSESSASNKSRNKHSKAQSEDKTNYSSFNTIRSVQLNRDDSGSLGLSIAGGIGSPLGDVPIMVANLNPTGPAARSQKLKVGDQILSINGESTESLSLDQAVQCLKSATGAITLRVSQGEEKTVSVSHSSKQHSMDGGTLPSFDQVTPGENADESAEPQYKTIVLNRGVDGLGFSIVGGHGSPHGDLPIYVKNVFSKGAASEDGTLKRGDQILAVNGESLEGLNHEQAVTILKQTTGTVTLMVLS